MAFRTVFRRPRWAWPAWILAAFFLLAAGAAMLHSTSTPAWAEVGDRGESVQPTLLQQLNAGLFARTAEERAFNKKVVQLVREGKLPISLVQSTFMWARNRQPYPMVYFEFALRLRAKRAGIEI